MLRRVVVITCATGVLLTAAAGTALAGDPWGNVDCTQEPYAGCELGAGKDGRSPTTPRNSGPAPRSSGGDSESDASATGPRGDVSLTEPNLKDCRYERSDYRPPSDGTQYASHELGTGDAVVVIPAVFEPAGSTGSVRFAQQDDPPGAWYDYVCTGEGVRDGFFRPPVFIPDSAPAGGGTPPLSPEGVAQLAYNQLRLPAPDIRTNPAGRHLVNLPSWLWLTRSSWAPVSATASVPGVSVTATAEPESVRWQLGDGATVTCEGPGTPYRAGTDPRASSPNCGHTYRRSSLGEPDDRFAVSAMATWTVRWSGAGRSGTFPGLTTTQETSFVVAESQAVNHN